MSLEQYSKAGDNDTFTYWLESATEDLGSVWGGSSFKFGVYSRRDLTDKESGKGLRYDAQYGWYKKYGDTAQEAFARVRAIIVQVAQAARAGDLAAIQKADLGTAIKWKIAFLYQDFAQPQIVPIYKQESLQALANAGKRLSCPELHRLLMQQRGERDIFEFGLQAWTRLEALRKQALGVAEALKYLQESENYEPVKTPTDKAAGFRTADGRELALLRENATPTLFLAPGPWLTPALQSLLGDVTEYAPGKSRTSALGANAPALAEGNAALKVTVPTMNALLELSDAYASAEQADTNPIQPPAMTDSRLPLNQILYGPPGTGKTYATIERAIEVLDPALYRSNPTRKALKDAFDQYVKDGQVRFVTFHQSFSYEDFVEGIRAIPPEENSGGDIKYAVEPGVFKSICEAAVRNQRLEKTVGISAKPRVWKLSIEEASSDGHTRQYCLEHGEARIGWENAGDLKENHFRHSDDLGSKEKSSLQNFAHGIAPGDIVVCLKTARTIQAVGVVTGPYEYQPEVPKPVRPDYVHRLPVHWLATGIDFDITPLNNEYQLTLQAVYRLSRVGWAELHEALVKAGVKLKGLDAPVPQPPLPHVLIIDEINRGNVSRIFGELITLIEPDKRAGGNEELKVVLPYSKKPFAVPDNVYLIGTMNTADRSLAGLDIALRRRFEFREVMPDPKLLAGARVEADGKSLPLDQLLATMNQRIEALLDREHTLGHAYFWKLKDGGTLPQLAEVFRKRIIPLLQEYFFDDWRRIQWVLNDHRKQDPALRFVDAGGPSFDTLFGPDVQVPGRRQNWCINSKAFDQIDSYLAIIAADASR